MKVISQVILHSGFVKIFSIQPQIIETIPSEFPETAGENSESLYKEKFSIRGQLEQLKPTDNV